jgi:hypothetical protein
MTQFEAQAAAPILRDVFGDAEVRQLGCEPFDAGRLIAERIKGA